MSKWSFYTTNEIKPTGWLRRQLEIQAQGLSGNLDKVWRDVRDSAWIGGDAESWERVPYWLDGFIPLAYLLENEDMIRRAGKYMDAIVSNQQADGWICPCREEERPSYDSWAVLLITKVLVTYYECSRDERIPEVVYRALKNYYALLKDEKIKLFAWGKARWFEGFIALNFLHKRYKEQWITELAKLLKKQGAEHLALMPKWERPLNKWTLETHIVNLVMCLKGEAVSHELLEEPYTDSAETLYTQLYQYNGTPVGLFTGDECLSGLSPIQGTELCAVVEQMYSYQHLFADTGDSKWAERLELLAFNALPAAISDDMWAHQYVQMSNQIACIRFPGKSLFRTNDSEAHLFGLEPNYGCCTANFGQGWPKFALSAFLHDGDSIINAVPVPADLTCDKAEISVITEYPFENSFKYTVKAKEDFRLIIRIPSYAKGFESDCGDIGDGQLIITLKAGESKEIRIGFHTAPAFIERPHQLTAVKCGSLIFSVPIAYDTQMYEYEKKGVERKFPYCDYEYIPKSDWNYGYSSEQLIPEYRKTDEIPFSSENPPVIIKAKVKPIAWGLEDGYETVCAKVPQSREPIGEEQEILLYPYGCAKLRMTELPKVD